MKNKIILNWLPPAEKSFPPPSMTVLRTSLVKSGYSVEIIYWNILLEDIINEYLLNEKVFDNELLLLSIFYAYIANENDNEEYLLKQELFLRSIKPQYRIQDRLFYQKHIEKMSAKLKNRIDEILAKVDFSEVVLFGLSMNLYQWIPAIVIAPFIKAKYPSLPIIIGGIGTSKAAQAFLRNFSFFDIAMWGEGETALVDLVNTLVSEDEKRHFDNVSDIAYRNLGTITLSKKRKKEYVDLSSVDYPDYDDYFNIIADFIEDKSSITLPIEASRGCHWKQCKFCFLNEGYKYRKRTPESIISEIDFMIQKYNCYNFNFLDNDVIGKDQESFNHLLNLLMELKVKYPEFQILLAEIITQGIEASTIKKMSLSGFIHVQIGYESPSGTLLNKIHKKNTFASNLMFCKWASTYSIRINGLNVLKGLLEETDADIKESIDNIHYLRFIFLKGYFEHNMSQLAIGESSRYYNELINQNLFSNYYEPITKLLVKDLIAPDDLFIISQYIGTSENMLWGYFEKIESYYLSNNFEYKLYTLDDDSVLYKEYLNKSEIKVLEFNYDSLEWKILLEANKRIVSKELFLKLNFEIREVEQAIDLLYEEGLVYRTSDYAEIVSIINTDLNL